MVTCTGIVDCFVPGAEPVTSPSEEAGDREIAEKSYIQTEMEVCRELVRELTGHPELATKC